MNQFLQFLFGKPAGGVTLEQSAATPGCSNCGAELSGPFCSVCGQKKEHKHDLTVWHFLGHSLHEFTHFDSRFFRSFKYLLFKPGYLTEEFIAGHRKNYINPIRLFIIVNVLYLLLPSVNTFTTPLRFQMEDRNRSWIRPMVNNKISATGISYSEYEREFDRTIKEHAELLIVCMVLLFSVLLSVLYVTQRRYYVEHLIFSLNIYSIVLVLLGVGMIAFELVLGLFLLLYEKLRVLFHFTNRAGASDDFMNIIKMADGDTFLSFLITPVLFLFLFVALRRVYRESNFVTFLKTGVITCGLYGILMLYRVILFFTTFYTMHTDSPKDDYVQQWTAVGNENSPLPWIRFNWVGDSAGGKYFDKMAMTVPVAIERLPHAFTMQFDMGSDATMVYGNTIRPYLDHYDLLRKELTTDKRKISSGKPIQQFKGMSIGLDSQYFKSDFVFLKRDYGDSVSRDSLFAPTPRAIGTIGVDICHDKVLILDYPNRRFCLLDYLPEQYKCSFSDFSISENGRVLLNMAVKGKTYKVLFDNGSSLFPLLMPDALAQQFSLGNHVDSLILSSWGKPVSFAGRMATDTLSLGGKTFYNVELYTPAMKGAHVIPPECDAITGNALFWNNVLVIDFKNKKFGVK